MTSNSKIKVEKANIETAWARVGITFKDTPEVRKFLDCRSELGFRNLDSKADASHILADLLLSGDAELSGETYFVSDDPFLENPFEDLIEKYGIEVSK